MRLAVLMVTLLYSLTPTFPAIREAGAQCLVPFDLLRLRVISHGQTPGPGNGDIHHHLHVRGSEACY